MKNKKSKIETFLINNPEFSAKFEKMDNKEQLLAIKILKTLL